MTTLLSALFIPGLIVASALVAGAFHRIDVARQRVLAERRARG